MNCNPPALERWLEIATANLAEEGKARVRAEIEAHYWEAVEELLSEGIEGERAEALSLEKLGDSNRAAREFSGHYLTIDEFEWIQNWSLRSANGKWVTTPVVFFFGILSAAMGGLVLLLDPTYELGISKLLMCASLTIPLFLGRSFLSAAPERFFKKYDTRRAARYMLGLWLSWILLVSFWGYLISQVLWSDFDGEPIILFISVFVVIVPDLGFAFRLLRKTPTMFRSKSRSEFREWTDKYG